MSQIDIVAIFQVKEQFDAEFKQAVEKVVIASRAETGCVKYEVNQDVQNPLTYIFMESWASQDVIDVHGKTHHFKDFIAFLDGKVNSSEIHVLKKVI